MLKYYAGFKSQKEYQGINWEDSRNKYVKIKEIFIDRYPTEEADIERFPNRAKVEEIVTTDRISAKIKIIRVYFRKAVDSGKKSGGGRVVFTFYSLCQSLWGSSPAVNSIPNSIDSQDDSSEALESAASHFSSTVTDEIGLFDDHQKSQENTDSRDDAADDEEVNSNPIGQSQQYPGREKVKTFLKNRRSQKLSTRMGAESQMLQFAKEDLNLKTKLLEQLEKPDADFNQNITKVGRTMDTISNVMQQCVGILGNLAKGSQHYGQFPPNFVQHDRLLHLQNQRDFFNNGLKHNEQYHEKGALIKLYTGQNYLLKFLNVYMNGCLYTVLGK